MYTLQRKKRIFGILNKLGVKYERYQGCMEHVYNKMHRKRITHLSNANKGG